MTASAPIPPLARATVVRRLLRAHRARPEPLRELAPRGDAVHRDDLAREARREEHRHQPDGPAPDDDHEVAQRDLAAEDRG